MSRTLIESLTKAEPVPLNSRTYKNFGHKRQPTAGVTILWHGFLTFTFIGLGVEWKRVARFMLGDEEVKISFDPTDPVPKME